MLSTSSVAHITEQQQRRENYLSFDQIEQVLCYTLEYFWEFIALCGLFVGKSCVNIAFCWELKPLKLFAGTEIAF